MGFKDYSNAKYGDVKQNPSQFYTILDERQKEYKEGLVTERRDAYTVLPDVERAKRKIHFYTVIRNVFLVLGIVFVAAAIITFAIALPRVDAHAAWFPPLAAGCGLAFLIGFSFLLISRSAHVDLTKCRLVILSQEDEVEINIEE